MKLLTTLLLIISFSAGASEQALFSAPTERMNNVLLALSELQTYNIYCSPISGLYGEATLIISVATEMVQLETDNLPIPEGRSYCMVTVVDTGGRESDPSDNEFIVDTVRALPTQSHPHGLFPL